jgi:hypothetical protein
MGNFFPPQPGKRFIRPRLCLLFFGLNIAYLWVILGAWRPTIANMSERTKKPHHKPKVGAIHESPLRTSCPIKEGGDRVEISNLFA